jgi:hypothetical protein
MTHPLTIGATPKLRAHNVWRFTHDDRVANPRTLAEAAIVTLADGIDLYASTLNGPDYVLTPAVGELLSAFLTLLNGDIGHLDGGTCDAWARKVAARIGWDLDLGCMAHEAVAA